jgi:hypothetical protein
MAAAMPEGSADDSGADPSSGAESEALSGIWRSEYAYYSSGRGKQFSGVHYVVIRQQGPSLTIESLPHSTGSQLAMSLSLDGMTVTGTWEEQTSHTEYYKGAVYRGALQLLVSPSGGQMSGRWLGFGTRFQINNGDWELTRETRPLSRKSISAYELKV